MIPTVYKAPPTITRFMQDDARMRTLMGCFGSGKSSGCVMEVARRASMQHRGPDGKRKTRFAIARNCFDDTTEILTEKRGWVLFKDLMREDKVASLHGDKLVFETPSHHYAAPYDGEMIGYAAQNCDFLVTPDHNLWTSTINGRTKERAPYKHEHASVAFGKTNRQFSSVCTWSGGSSKYNETFFEFLGFWFAEGYAGVYKYLDRTHHRLVVSQKKHVEYTEKLLTSNGFSFGKSDKGDGNYNFVISLTPETKSLCEMLSGFGQSTTKHLPSWIKEAPVAHLRAFLRGFIMGDGSNKGCRRSITIMYTASKALADDLHEIAFRSGFAAVVAFRDRTGETQDFRGRTIKRGLCWTVTLLTNGRSFPKTRDKSRWYKKPYLGMVYCVEVSTHVVYVRRGGKAFWCGQTVPELRDTTIKTWMDWFPAGIAGSWFETAKIFTLKFDDVECEVMFRALDNEDDVKKLLSLELTGAFFNECREIPQAIVDGVDGRIGRYPSVRNGGCTWRGMFGDTNPPEEDSYWHRMMEGLDPKTGAILPNDWSVYKQPPGMIRITDPASPLFGKLVTNLSAENLEFLDPGYYENLARDKDPEFVKVYIEGKYGSTKSGKPVHPLFKEELHVAKDELVPNPKLLLVVSADFGLTPAMTLKQQDPFGRVLTLDEIVTENMGLKRAIAERLKPMLRNKYSDFNIQITGDPAGNTRSQNDERSCVEIFKEAKFKRVKFAYSNSPVHRIGATDSFLARFTEMGPAYLVDPKCSYLKRSLKGGYHYKVNKHGASSDSPEKNIYSHIGEANQYGDMFFERGLDGKDDEDRMKKIRSEYPSRAGAYTRRA